MKNETKRCFPTKATRKAGAGTAKILSVLLAAVLLFCAVPLGALALTSGEWEYNTYKDGVSITKYNGSDTDLVIPSELDGLPVIALDGLYFQMSKNANAIESLTIPGSIKSISGLSLKSLKKVVLLDGVENLGQAAFGNNKMLEEVVLPDSLKSIGEMAFYGCSSLKSITIPTSVTTIGNYAFGQCPALENIYLGENSNYWNWSNDYWYKNSGLNDLIDATVWLGDVKALGIENGFQYVLRGVKPYASAQATRCAKIIGYVGNETSVAIPAELYGYPVAIGELASADCETVTIAKGVSIVCDNAFANCSALKNIYAEAVKQPDGWYSEWSSDIPLDCCVWFNGVKSIWSGIDENGLQYTVKNGTVTITDYTGTASNLVIPEEIDGYKVTVIADHAFAEAGFTEVQLPKTVLVIEEWAFYDCTNLTAMNIPGSVQSVYSCVFYGCDNLKEINCAAKSQPEGWHDDWNYFKYDENAGELYITANWGYCKHEKTEKRDEYTSCEESGSRVTYCADCGLEISREEIPAKGHNYRNGVCTVCGAETSYMAVAGDITGDGKIDLYDYMLIRAALLQTIEFDEDEFAAADVVKDGVISLQDVMLIKYALLGKIEL